MSWITFATGTSAATQTNQGFLDGVVSPLDVGDEIFQRTCSYINTTLSFSSLSLSLPIILSVILLIIHKHFSIVLCCERVNFKQKIRV